MMNFKIIFDVSVNLLKFGKNQLDSAELANTINELERTLYQSYFDRANTHFASCKETLSAIKNSKTPELEIRAAIHHLFDSYFSLYNLLEKKIEKQTIIGIKYSENYVKYPEDIYVPCCRIAIIIYSIYVFLDEHVNAMKWKSCIVSNLENAIREYKNYGDSPREIDEELYIRVKRISNTFVRRRLGYEWSSSVIGYSDSRGGPVIRHYITSAGCDYAYKQICELEKRVNTALNNEYIRCLEIDSELLL